MPVGFNSKSLFPEAGWKMGFLCLSRTREQNWRTTKRITAPPGTQHIHGMLRRQNKGCFIHLISDNELIWDGQSTPTHKNAPEQTTREYSVHNSEQPRDGKENRRVLGNVFSYVQGIHSFPLCWSYEFVRVHVFPLIFSHP